MEGQTGEPLGQFKCSVILAPKGGKKGLMPQAGLSQTVCAKVLTNVNHQVCGSIILTAVRLACRLGEFSSLKWQWKLTEFDILKSKT